MMEPWQAFVLALWGRGPMSRGARTALYVGSLASVVLLTLAVGEPLNWAIAIAYISMSFFGADRLEENWRK